MMLKKLIPAAVLLAFGGAAQAQMTIYGLVDMSYGKNEMLGTASAAKATFHSGGDDGSSQGNSTSRVGLKGSTNLVSGLKANFQLETAGITSEGRVGGTHDAFFNRQAWLGMSGGFGEVRLGKQDSVAFQTMVGFDFNGAANAVSAQANAGAATFAPGRLSRSLQYISPSVSGFKAQVGYAAIDPSAAANVTGSKSALSAGLTYTLGNLVLGAAAEGKRSDAAENFSSVAASYDFGVAKAMVGYADGGPSAKGTSVGVVAPVAGFNVGLQYSKNSDSKVSATEFFVNREIFKNTFAYFDYGTKDTPSASKQNAYALGVIYAF